MALFSSKLGSKSATLGHLVLGQADHSLFSVKQPLAQIPPLLAARVIDPMLGNDTVTAERKRRRGSSSKDEWS
jgi:hypothetical protein